MSIKTKIQNLNTAEQIILLNVVLFVLVHGLVYVGQFSHYQINKWVGLPQSMTLFATRPWTLITYAFFHASFQHLFWNMVFLFFMGRIFFNLFSTKQFLRVYFFGIVFGGISFLLIDSLFPALSDNSILLGSSGAIMSLLLFVCVIAPSYTLYLLVSLRVKLWVVALCIILFDLVQISSNPGGKIVHLGGAAIGYFMGVLAQQPTRKRKKNKEKLTENNTAEILLKPSKPKSELSEEQKIKQHKINIILDKISVSGYASLTDDEKKFLFDASKDMNTKRRSVSESNE